MKPAWQVLATTFSVTAVLSEAGGAAVERNDLFVGGRGGYHTYRIPALVVSDAGTILAFCEGRKRSAADDGDIDLLLKRSRDGGRSWSAQAVVHEEGGDAPITIGNPCPIVETGTERIYLLFTRNNKRLFYTRSTDDGRSWTAPVEYTSILRQFDYPVVRIGTGPGHGIRMGTGRLVAPVWLSDRERDQRDVAVTRSRFQSGVLYSDDNGATWHAGGLVPPTLTRLNEATVVETTDRHLLLNMRAHGAGFRAVTWSEDGGVTWSRPALQPALPCPTCQASMIRLKGRELLFLNPAMSKAGGYHGPSRRRLTLRLSRDDGRTWAHARVICAGPAGYSDLAVTNDGRILCLFENGEKTYRDRISIVAVSRAWLVGKTKMPLPAPMERQGQPARP